MGIQYIVVSREAFWKQEVPTDEARIIGAYPVIKLGPWGPVPGWLILYGEQYEVGPLAPTILVLPITKPCCPTGGDSEISEPELKLQGHAQEARGQGRCQRRLFKDKGGETWDLEGGTFQS